MEEKYGKFHFANAFRKPISGKLDTIHLDEMIPGFRNPNQRTLQIDYNTTDNSQLNDSGVSNIEHIDMEFEPVMNTNEHIPTNPSHMPFISMAKKFFDKVQQFRDCIGQIKADHQLQKDTIIQLQKEIESMKKEVTYAKMHRWCKKCLRQIESDTVSLCEDCSLHQ